MFSEKTTPISELVKGNPDRPLREPAMVLLACLFNLFQIYTLITVLQQVSVPFDPYSPFAYMSVYVLLMVPGLVGWYIVFTIILLIGAGIVYFINRRIGGAVILVISIIGLLTSFMAISIALMFSRNFATLFLGFLSPIIGLIAGIWGIRSKDISTPVATQEII